MFSMLKRVTTLTLCLGGLLAPWTATQAFEGIGRAAKPAEIQAWDIDVRPDFKGLPKGKGSVSLGQNVWDTHCAACHGTFGESNEVFTPIVGGTTAEDIKTGRVKALVTGEVPQRTTLMKVPTVSTLWDYINRAMPWNAPKSLKADEVYGVVAYILNMAEVVPGDFVLSDENIGDVQNKMPNRKGMEPMAAGMWLPTGKPDAKEKRCMANCKPSVTVTSFLPEYAQDAHGNLAEQNRTYGPVRGVVTVKGAGQTKK